MYIYVCMHVGKADLELELNLKVLVKGNGAGMGVLANPSMDTLHGIT